MLLPLSRPRKVAQTKVVHLHNHAFVLNLIILNVVFKLIFQTNRVSLCYASVNAYCNIVQITYIITHFYNQMIGVPIKSSLSQWDSLWSKQRSVFSWKMSNYSLRSVDSCTRVGEEKLITHAWNRQGGIMVQLHWAIVEMYGV